MGADVTRVAESLRQLREAAARTGCVADWGDASPLAAAALAPRGDLHGEPVTVKDWIDVTGFRCSGADVAHAERRPAVDAPAVARLRAAGAVVVAKTAVHVDSERFGPVRHPHDPSRSPGGSSSGDGVAVGSGSVRLGIGSDSGGSVRVPAAWCGVVGLKPSTGLVPVTGHFPRVGDRSDGRTTLGALASSVDLAWRAVRVMAGPDGADGAVAPVSLGDPATVDLTSLSVSVGTPGGRRVSAEVEDALARSREVLRDAGARDAGPPPDWIDEALRVAEAYWQREDRSGAQIEQDLLDWDRFRRDVLRATRTVDVIVTPTVSSMAPLHRAMRTEDYLFCLPASLTGGPALSVPVAGGAVQVLARRWQDHLVVAVARLLEAAGGC